MKKGIHLYININKLNTSIKDNRDDTRELTRIFHWIASYLTSMESFINRYNDDVYIEKLTGTRMHLVIYEKANIANIFIEIVAYAFNLVNETKNIGRYNKLTSISLSMGADFGIFTEYLFEDLSKDFAEETTIGYPANYAAKIQVLAQDNEVFITNRVAQILIDNEINKYVNFGKLDPRRISESVYRNRELPEILKLDIFSLENYINEFNKRNIFNSEIKKFIEKQSSKNNTFGDIDFTDSRVKIDFENVSLKSPKRTEAVIIYADIRGFTKQFNKDGSNLLEMTEKTQKALMVMYDSVMHSDSTHVQFQGDRESALRNRYGDNDYVLAGLYTALTILEKIRNKTDFEVGIGCSYGKVFASRVGMRGRKHNLILGSTVREAEEAEDIIAGPNQIAITKEMYDYLIDLEDGKYSNNIEYMFIRKNNHYITEKGFDDFTMYSYENTNTGRAKKDGSYKPWNSN